MHLLCIDHPFTLDLDYALKVAHACIYNKFDHALKVAHVCIYNKFDHALKVAAHAFLTYQFQFDDVFQFGNLLLYNIIHRTTVNL